MEKRMSDNAAAAKAIRQWLKAQGIVGQVRSESYSGGSSVDINVQNIRPAQYEQIKAFANNYKYGHFDGMQDLYEYSNVNRDLPQVKYVFVNNRPSDELNQQIWDFARGYYSVFADAPADAKMAYSFRVDGWYMNGSEMIWRLFSGAEMAYWNFVNEQEQAAA